MASQDQDLEKGISAIPAVPDANEPRIRTSTAPTGFSYMSDTRPLSVSQQPSVQGLQVPQVASTHSAATLNQTDNLSKFQQHLGIHTIEEFLTNRAAANLGIFPRIVQNEKAAHRQYQIFSWLINGALGLQIIFAAALTALGAGDGPRSAVTAFGAMNTVLAGLLTFVKGSGLPNRLKYYENEWTKVREYIEQRERDFAHVTQLDHELDLLEEIAVIERMYENVRRDIEANTPDSYISMSKATGPGNATPSLARGLSAYSQKAQDRLSQFQDGARERFSHAQSGIDSRIRGTHSMASGGLQDARSYTNERIRTAKDLIEEKHKGVQSNVQASVEEIQAEADAQIRNIQEATDARVREMQSTVRQGEERVKTMEAKAISATEKAAEKVLSFIHHRKEGQ